MTLLVAQGCSKEDNEISDPQTELPTLSEAERIEIESLRLLLSEITFLPLDKIIYDQKTESFYYMGVKQITIQTLREIRDQK